MTFYTSGNAAGGREMLVETLRWMTVYESSNATNPRDRLQRVVKRNGDLLGNSTALMATSVMTSLLGFVYWWVAARQFPAEAVGVASAAISAMTLIGTLGMFGMGTLLISELPRSKDGQWTLISTCVTVAAIASTIGSVVYVFLALFVIPGLRASLDSPLGIVLLVVATGLNGALLVLDEGLVGLLAGHLQLLRNAYFAVGKLVFIAVLAALPVAANGADLLATWLAGMILSLLLIALPLHSRRGHSTIRPNLPVLRGLARRAMDHNLLNIALFLPRICLPLVVTSVVSTRATAAFYTAWMVMAFLAMIPGSIATTLFAVASGDMAGLRSKVRLGLVMALGAGVPLSLGIALFARPLMGLFGRDYEATAGAALSILALTYAGTAIRQFYVAISRVSQRTRQASFLAVAIGVIELSAAWEGGHRGGLIGTVSWLAVVMLAEGLVLAPPVVRVVFTKVAPAPPAAEGESSAAERLGGSPAVANHRRPEPPPTRIRHKRSRFGRSSSFPRPRPANPPMDQTAIIPLRPSDATMIIPKQRAEETAILFMRDIDTLVFDRPALDETANLPRIVDEPAQAAPHNGIPHSVNGDGPPVEKSTVDTRAETAIIPRIAAGIPTPPPRYEDEMPVAGARPRQRGQS